MATDMDQAYREWPHDELSDLNDSREASVSQFVDHGSISFGRFAAESLSWEKWSVFSHNRCQEELEKFKAPGLVAQKKAYFEEYYKRIRALKALQQDQQAAPGSDTGGNSSVCSQNGVQNTSHVENTVQVTTQVVQSEKSIVEDTVEQETKSIDSPQLQYLVTESVVPYPNSCRRRISNERIEEIRQPENDCNNLSDEMMTRNDDRSNESIEEINQEELNCNSLSNDRIMRKGGCSMSAVRSEAAAQGAAPKQLAIIQKDLGVTLADGPVPKKIERNNKKYKDCTSVHKIKEAATSDIKAEKLKLKHDSIHKGTVAVPVRNDVKMNHQTKAITSISLQGLKYPHRTATSKAENVINSSNPVAHMVLGNKKSTSISSNRPLAGARSHVHRSMPHLMERRAAVPASTRDSAPQHSISIASNSNARLPVHPKGKSSIQNMSMEVVIPRGMNNTALEARRNHEVATKSMVLDSRHTTLRGRDAEVARLKAISSKFSARSKSIQSGGLECSLQSNDMGKKQNEVKEKEEPRKFCHSSNSAAFPLPSFSKIKVSKPEHNKKIISSCSVDLTRGAGKSRQGMPYWR